MPVRVVTDSTAQLPPHLLRQHRISVVPLHVTVDGAEHRDGVDIGPDELAAVLAGRRHPTVTTSRCSPGELAAAYRAADAGDGVVALHLSGELSGTASCARLAAAEVAGGPHRTLVRVVDSRSTAMGLGFPVLAAARVAGTGAGLDAVVAAAADTVRRCRTLLCVDTLEHLRRGGRIGVAAAALGTALAVKPLLHVRDGHIVRLEKVRTSARALVRLAELAVAESGDAGPGDDEPAVAVHHLAAPERAARLVSELRQRIPRIGELHVSEVGAVLGAHLGPGMVGVVVCRGGAGPPDEPKLFPAR